MGLLRTFELIVVKVMVKIRILTIAFNAFLFKLVKLQ